MPRALYYVLLASSSSSSDSGCRCQRHAAGPLGDVRPACLVAAGPADHSIWFGALGMLGLGAVV